VSSSVAAPASSPDYVARWTRARERVEAHGFDGLYVTAGPTFTWLSGATPYPGGWPDFASCLLLPLDRDPVMLISAMHAEILDRQTCAVADVLTYMDGEDPTPVLREAFARTGLTAARLAVENHIWLSDVELAAAAAPSARLGRSPLFEALRAVKDSDELALLRRSAACQDAAFVAARDVMAVGGDLSEVEVAIRAAMMAEGCESIKLLGVFRSTRPRRFQADELIDIDFGTAFCGGYTIDSSRNVFFGETTARLRDQWELVVAAYDAAAAAVRPGALAADVHRAGADVIEAGGERQTWKMGHGVGLSDGHEAPWLQDGSETVLEPGMAFTIDPGFFVGRDLPLHLENTVVVTESGCESLNRFPNEIVAV
jgi:Xaa-Pro aminopeptidase